MQTVNSWTRYFW